MRNRHFPRLCPACQAPMECQEEVCWRCATAWTGDPEPRATLRLVHDASREQARPVSTAERLDRLRAEAHK